MSRYYKILPRDLKCRRFQYHEGLNIDSKEITPYVCDCGLHFADKDCIMIYCDCGSIIAEVEIPEDAIVYHFNTESKADRIILKNLRPLWSVDTIKDLIREGVNFESYKGNILCEAASKGYLDVVKFFIEQGVDIHSNNDCALRFASEFGHFDVVKYLVEQGANIHARKDYAIKYAGTAKIKKYLKSLR